MNRTILGLLLTSALTCVGAAGAGSGGCAALRRGVAQRSRPIESSAPATQPTLRRESFHITITKTIGYDFILQLPRDYRDAATSEKRFPLIIFLHGSGECGNDLSKLANHGLPKLAAQRADFPFIFVAPQSPSV